MNLIYCVPHFVAAREAEKVFWPPKPPVPLRATSFGSAEDEELIRWARECARKAKKYPDRVAHPDDFEPYRREKAARLSGPVFVARQAEPSHLRVAGERAADVLVRGISVRKPRGRAGYRGERTLEDPEFRAYLATFLDEDVVASWYAITKKERISIRNRKRCLERAEKGSPDRGRTWGVRTADVLESNREIEDLIEQDRRTYPDGRRPRVRTAVDHIARKRGKKPETLRRRLYR